MTLLAAFDVWFNLGMMAFFGVCLLLILMIMIQKPQGGGLSAAFGASSGSGQTAFGTKTGDALTVATIILFGVWIIVATVLNLAGNPAVVVVPPVKASAPADNTSGEGPVETPASNPPVNPAPASVPPVNPAPAVPPESTPGATPGSTPPVPQPVNPVVNPPAAGPAATPPAPTTPPAGDPPANPR